MRARGDTIRYVGLLTFLPQIFLGRLLGYDVFHLHWANAFLLRSKREAYWRYLLCLKAIKLLGYKLVWTAHNVLPHEPAFPDDIAARRKLVDAADLVIAHSELTLQRLREIGAEPKRSVIIPHGSYVGMYPDTISRATARNKLGLAAETFVYLFLGTVREYKGLNDLLVAYEKIKNGKNKLIVAGMGSSAGYIPDDDLQTYFNAADVVVLPFKEVSTSGSALLALSFGRAVIVPRLGDLDNLPDAVAYKYSPQESDGLLRPMRDAEQDVALLRQKSRAALRYAEELGWPLIARRTHEAIEDLFANS